MNALTLKRTTTLTHEEHASVVNYVLGRVLARVEEGHRQQQCSYEWLEEVRAAKESAEKLKGAA